MSVHAADGCHRWSASRRVSKSPLRDLAPRRGKVPWRDPQDPALERNPAIREAAARYRAALQLVPQVRALPDPMATFTQTLRSVESVDVQTATV